MAVTIHDIATRLHLSNSTVSRVLNNKGHDFISAGTRQRVLAAARDMGYRPNPAARALVQRRTELVALWTPLPYAAYYAQIIYQITTAMNAEGRDVISREAGWQEDAAEGVARIGRCTVDGVIACDANRYLRALLDTAPDTPAVGMGSYLLPACDFVTIDNTAAAREAVRHLLARGPRVVHLLPEEQLHPGEFRHDAYLEVMAAHGAPAVFLPCPAMSRAAARTAVTAYCRTHRAPQSLFCHNDEMAIGAYRALRDLGLRVPHDVALVGCDGIAEGEYLETPLTTIVQPVEEMCRLAVQFLHQRLHDPALPIQQCTLVSHLAIRGSSG
jgi:LacI family transcriptional regulator